MEPRLRLKKSLPQAGLEPGTARSADQRRQLSYRGLSPEKAQFVVRNAKMSNYKILSMPLSCTGPGKRVGQTYPSAVCKSLSKRRPKRALLSLVKQLD